jgi:general secretion pathway protein K
MMTRKYDRGIALLATLVSVALMTLMVADFTTSAALGYRTAANQADQLRAYYLARSGIQVGLAVLARNSVIEANDQHPHEGFDQAWAQPIPPISVDGGTIFLSIVDEARKIDINSLFNQSKMQTDGTVAEILLRLFSNINVSPDLLPVLIDWLDPDSIESEGGAEADYYLRLKPPYEPRNGPMPTIGDMRMLKGMDDATFMRLSQYLTTIAASQSGAFIPAVNVNTAAPEVLAALLPQLENDPELVGQLVEIRQVRPFVQITDVLNLSGISPFEQNLSPLITVSSNLFTITAQGEFAGARRRIYATFRCNNNGTAMLQNWHED